MFEALLLGAVQGLTEFVPVSSSGHLVLVPFVLNWDIPGLAFDVAVHLGTAVAVVVYFHRELVAVVAGAARTATRRASDEDRAMARLAVLLGVATVPAAVVGLLFEDAFAEAFSTPPLVAVLLLGTAGLLVLGEFAHDRRDPAARRGLDDVRLTDALVVGAMQALAILPGISRSGATITGGLVRGVSRDAAARFSFLLGLPAFVGAGILKVPDLPPGTDVAAVAGATAVAAVTGVAAIAFLLRFVRTRSLRPFAAYCVFASVIALGYWFQVR